ncbi:MAG: GNAT family N-acetyltransferase [Sneathiella sp.]
MITVTKCGPTFNQWSDLLALIQKAYAYMEDRIDPPSSMHKLTKSLLQQKAKDETLLLALEKDRLIGCAFVREQEDSFYIGKLAVDTSQQGQGIGQQIIHACIQLANEADKPDLELETRIELLENHAFFSLMGFKKTAENAHKGYDQPTSITMQRPGKP